MSVWQTGKGLGMKLIHEKETAGNDIVLQMVNLKTIQTNLDNLTRRADVAEIWIDREGGCAVIGFVDSRAFPLFT